MDTMSVLAIAIKTMGGKAPAIAKAVCGGAFHTLAEASGGLRDASFGSEGD